MAANICYIIKKLTTSWQADSDKQGSIASITCSHIMPLIEPYGGIKQISSNHENQHHGHIDIHDLLEKVLKQNISI